MRVVLAAVLAVVAVGALCSAVPQGQPAQRQGELRLTATIPLPDVGGRIDHLAFDAARQRLFIAALGNDTVEVIDTSTNAHLRSLSGFHEPQGLAVLPDLGAVAIANGNTGTLQLLDASTLQTKWTINI